MEWIIRENARTWRPFVYQAFATWTLVWWALDGIGTLIWGRVCPTKGMSTLGFVEAVAGAAGIVLASGQALHNSILWCPVLTCLLVLTVLRIRWNWPARTRLEWEKRWREIGEPGVWQGMFLFLTVPLIICAVVLQIALGFGMIPAERTLWAWIIGACIAATTSPGGYGLGANRVTRWVIRVTVPACLLAALVFLFL